MADLFRRLGATFIKVGQIMSTRPDLFPPHLIRALGQLQDNVGPFAFSHVARTIGEDLGRPPEQIFAQLDPRPIASASVAQVHRARLPDGTQVAVKVRRPDIQALVEFDLAVMRLFARAIAMIPTFALLAPVESLNEFGRGICMQLDFTIEAANNQRFRRNFAGVPGVIFPTLVEPLCSSRVLVMEFIEGEKIFETTHAEPKRLAALGFQIILKMIFEDGFVHADLHPGNLLITVDDRVAILDLGLVGELDLPSRQNYARYFAAWISGDTQTMARLMTGLNSEPLGDHAGFERALADFVKRHQSKTLGEVQASVVYFEMMNIMRRFRVRLSPTFTLVNIAIAVTEGIAKQLDPSINLMEAARPFFAKFDFAKLANG